MFQGLFDFPIQYTYVTSKLARGIELAIAICSSEKGTIFHLLTFEVDMHKYYYSK